MLKKKYKENFSDSSIKWNFTKFLIDRNGSIKARFEPTIDPKNIESIIKSCI